MSFVEPQGRFPFYPAIDHAGHFTIFSIASLILFGYNFGGVDCIWGQRIIVREVSNDWSDSSRRPHLP
jgi:hypothetical protein